MDIELSTQNLFSDLTIAVEHFTFYLAFYFGKRCLGIERLWLDSIFGDFGACAQNQRTECEIVKDFAAVPPNIGRTVFADTLIVEAVYCRNLARFVVSSDQRDAIWVADFETQQEQKRLETVKPSVDKIAHEEIVGVRNVTANSKEFHQVVELPVYVATYSDRRIHCDHIAFFYQQFSRFVA